MKDHSNEALNDPNGAVVVDSYGEVVGFLRNFLSGDQEKPGHGTVDQIPTREPTEPEPETLALWSGHRRKPNLQDLITEGMALWRLNRCAKALPLFDRVISQAPRLGIAWWAKGLCALPNQSATGAVRRNANAIAEGCFTRAVVLNPELAQAHLDLALVYLDEGKHSLALREYLLLTSFAPELARGLRDKLATSSGNSRPTGSITLGKE